MRNGINIQLSIRNAQRSTRVSTSVAFALLIVSSFSFAEDPKLAILSSERWGNVFGGKEEVFHFVVTGQEAFKGKAGWVFAVDGATVARGERDIAIDPANPATIEVKLRIPTTREGVVLSATLGITVGDASFKKPIWIFPENPFADRTQWLKELKITLFDPEKKTAELFDKIEIPYTVLLSAEALAEMKDGVVIIGEGVSFADYRGLAGAMTHAAANGAVVLCLSPSGGTMPLAGTDGVELPQPRSQRWMRAEVITELDKRLDAIAWPPDGKIVARSFVTKVDRGRIVSESVNGAEGWPWMETRFGSKGKLLICGFGIVEKWDASPSPRFLLARLFEYLNEEKSETENKR